MRGAQQLTLPTMPRSAVNGPPSPEEFQKQLGEFMRQQFNSLRGSAAFKTASSTVGPDGDQDKPEEANFRFDYKP